MNSAVQLLSFLITSGVPSAKADSILKHYLSSWGINHEAERLPQVVAQRDLKFLGNIDDLCQILETAEKFDFSILYSGADFINPYFKPISLADWFLSIKRSDPESLYVQATGRHDFLEQLAFMPLVTHEEFLGKPRNWHWLSPGLCSLRAAILRCYMDISVYGDIRLVWTKVSSVDHLSYTKNDGSWQGVGHSWSRFSTSKLRSACGRVVSPQCVAPDLRNNCDAAFYWKDFQHSIESDRDAVTYAIHLTLVEAGFPVHLESGKFLKAGCNNYQWKIAQTIICHLYRAQFFKYPNLNFNKRYVPLAMDMLVQFRSYLVNLNEDLAFYSNRPQLVKKASHEKKIPKETMVDQEYLEEEVVPTVLRPEELAVLKDAIVSEEQVHQHLLDLRYEGLQSLYDLEQMERQLAQGDDTVNMNKLKKLRNRIRNERSIRAKGKALPQKEVEVKTKTLEEHMRDPDDGTIYLACWFELGDTLEQFQQKVKTAFGLVPEGTDEAYALYVHGHQKGKGDMVKFMSEHHDEMRKAWVEEFSVKEEESKKVITDSTVKALDDASGRLGKSWVEVARHVLSEKQVMENPEIWYEAHEFKRAVKRVQRVKEITYDVKVLHEYETRHIVPLGTSLYRKVDLGHIAREQAVVRHRCTPVVRHMKQTLIRAKNKMYHKPKTRRIPPFADNPVVFLHDTDSDAEELGPSVTPNFQVWFRAYRFQKSHLKVHKYYYHDSFSKLHDPIPAAYPGSSTPNVPNWRKRRRKTDSVHSKTAEVVAKFNKWVGKIPDYPKFEVPNEMFEIFNSYKEAVVLKKISWSSKKMEGRARRVSKSPKDRVYKTLFLQRQDDIVM